MFKKNSGKYFEELIEWSNAWYLQRNQAVIQKIATPWVVIRRYNPISKRTEIATAYPEKKSTVDFGGTAQGKSIWFDAKTTQNATSFPLSNIEEHQIKFLKQVQKQGGLAFILIHIQTKETFWLLWIDQLLKFIQETDRKSIPFDWLENNCSLILPRNGIVVDYLTEAFKKEG